MLIRWREVWDRASGLYLHDTLDMSQIQRENRAVIRIFPASVQIHAFLQSDVLHVAGEASAAVVYRCSRCLKDFEGNLSAKLDEQFVQRAVTVEEEEEDIRQAEGDIIDLDPSVEEALVLSLPYRPLCDEHCAGLCPACGINLNVESCSCDTTAVDPRLADLKRLLPDQE